MAALRTCLAPSLHPLDSQLFSWAIAVLQAVCPMSRELRIRVNFESNRLGQEHLKRAYEFLAPITRRRVRRCTTRATSVEEQLPHEVRTASYACRAAAGKTWSLSSFAYSNGRLYARTLKELICIGD